MFFTLCLGNETNIEKIIENKNIYVIRNTHVFHIIIFFHFLLNQTTK